MAPKTLAEALVIHETRASKFKLVCACTVLFSVLETAYAPIYGQPASIVNFPYVVGIYYWEPVLNGNPTNLTIPFCTGTIATLDWVVTTYHCIFSRKPNDNPHRGETLSASNIRMVAASAYAPVNKTTWPRYDSRNCTDMKGPNTDDFVKILNYNEFQAKQALLTNNLYADSGLNNTKGIIYRYYLNFALLKANKPWQIGPFVDTGLFPALPREVVGLWWEEKVNETKSGTEYMQPCYVVGWGGWDESIDQMRLRFNEVKFVPYSNCELSYCTLCADCADDFRINSTFEACYESVIPGDACPGDEGSPLWCPWYGHLKSGDTFVRTGAILGFLSYWNRCLGSNIPSIYTHSWNIYERMSSIVGGASWPPSIWVFSEHRERETTSAQ